MSAIKKIRRIETKLKFVNPKLKNKMHHLATI